MKWKLAPGEVFVQETLPHPAVNVVLGTHRAGVHGVVTKRFVVDLRGSGWVVGARFAPGVFFPFLGRDVATITDRDEPVPTVFGSSGKRAVRAAESATFDERVRILESLLLGKKPKLDAAMILARDAVRLAQREPSIARADGLAKECGVGVRTLERLFKKHVGCSPKIVIRRFRVHEACLRVQSGERVVWTKLAQDLSYFDQAHFIRDFKSQVGRTPLEYAKLCEAASARG